MNNKRLVLLPTRLRARLAFTATAALLGIVAMAGLSCNAFNPAFLDTLDGSGQGRFSTINNAPGHVVIAFVNNATVNERIISYLESPDGGNLVLTDAEKRGLRPVLRLRVRVTYVDQSEQVLEFLSGSRELVSPDLADLVQQDLADPDFTNGVAICDVQSVEVLDADNAGIEVFVPVPVTEFEFVQPQDFAPSFFNQTDQVPPAFRPLQTDFLADDGTIVRANIGTRNIPAPVQDPRCGSVIAIVAEGELDVPFLNEPEAEGRPSYDAGRPNQQASIGGRYEFIVSVQ